jgi:hypothetical protein
MTKEWKTIVESEFNYKLWIISDFYNIPLLLNKNEMFQVYLHREFLKSENKEPDFMGTKSITRKNYLWLYILENSISSYSLEYKKIKTLANKIKTFKNTLH